MLLKKPEYIYEELVEKAGIAILIDDRDGGFKYFNDTFGRLFGYPATEMKEKTIRQLVHPDDIDMVMKYHHGRILGETVPDRYEFRGIRKDGSTVYLEVAVVKLEENEEVVGTRSYIWDVTERKRADEYIHHIIDSSPYMIVSTDKKSRIVEFNKAAQTAFGYGREEVLGRYLNTLYASTEDGNRLFQAIRETGKYMGEVKYVRKNGRTFPASLSVTVMRDAASEVIGLMGVSRDITEQKRVEGELANYRQHLEELVEKRTVELEKEIKEHELTEKSLRESEEKHRTLQANIPVGVFRSTADPLGRLISCNRALAVMFGYETPEEMFKTRVADLYLNAEDRAEFIETVSSAGAVSDYEIPFKRLDGTPFYGSISARAVKGSDGKIAYFDGILEDITEREAAEKAVKESEEKYRNLVERANDGIVILQDGLVEYANERMADISDYKVEEIIGTPFVDYVHPDEIPEIIDRYERRMAGEDVISVYETVLKNKRGDDVHAEINAGVITFQGKPANLVLVRDITERKLADKAILESEERYRTLQDNIPVGVFRSTADPLGRLISANRALANMYGYETPEEMLETPVADLYLDPEGRVGFIEAVSSAGAISDYVVRMKKAEGTPFWGSLTARAVEGPNGKVAYFDGILKDITEHKRAEEEIRKLTQFQEMVIDSADVWLTVIDETGNVIIWNKAAEEVSGYSRGEVIGSTEVWYKLFPNEEYLIDIIKGVGRTALNGDGVREQEVTIATKPGEKRVISWASRGITDESGAFVGTVILGRDVTDVKLAEEELIKASKMESISALAGGIAHDFKNLLTVILGNVSYVKSNAFLPDGKFVEALGDAEEASLTAKALTEQLLTFSKGGAPVKETLDVETVVRESAAFAVHGSNVRCIFHFPNDLWAIIADDAQIRQVINNVVINAVQAMPDGGEVNVRCENVLVKGKRRPGLKTLAEAKYVEISVVDAGPGIPEENMQKVFDPFFTTKNEGSGLGLATSYSIVKNHGGLIEIESELGVGSTFIIYLPASLEQPDAVKPRDDRLYPGKGNVLLMDDEKGIRDLLDKVLCRAGYDVELAKDGNEALAAYKRAMNSGESFDVVILDLTVPGGMGGKETMKELLTFDPNVKAIVSSGYSTDPVLAEFEKHGFRRFVKKPFDISELTKTLHEVINEGQSVGFEKDNLPAVKS